MLLIVWHTSAISLIRAEELLNPDYAIEDAWQELLLEAQIHRQEGWRYLQDLTMPFGRKVNCIFPPGESVALLPHPRAVIDWPVGPRACRGHSGDGPSCLR